MYLTGHCIFLLAKCLVCLVVGLLLESGPPFAYLARIRDFISNPDGNGHEDFDPLMV